MQNFEQKLSFFRLVSKIQMGHVTNLTIIIFNQLLVQICIFGKNLKLIALFFPKLRTILIISSNFKNSEELYNGELSRTRVPNLGRLPNIYETLVQRLTHGSTRPISLPKWCIPPNYS